MTAEAATPRRAASRTPLIALLGANAVSLVGNGVTGLAIPWFVLETTGSAARTGLVAFAGLVPTVLAALLGGALVDRLGFKRTSVLADLASGLTVAAIPLLGHTVGLAFWQLLALTFLGALLDAPGGTARGSLLPDLAVAAAVPLERANAASQTVQGLASLLGPPLAGLLIVAVGPSDVLWLDAATFAVSAGLVATLVPARGGSADGRGRDRDPYLDEVRAGLRFLRDDRLVRSMAVTGTAVNFLVAPLFGVLLPVYARTAFGNARDLGVMIAGFGAGSLVGSIVFGAVGPRLPRRPTLIGTVLVAGAPFWVLSAEPPLPVGVVALVVDGVAVGALNPLAGTILQERIPVDLRGRVLGAFMAAILVAAPLGVLLAGALTEAVGPRPLLLGMGVAFVAVAVSMLANPAFRTLDR
jgi:MFS family permease